ncbi:cilia- and flagella-associated protein HOATZ isoform X2 [Onychostoma macrolepis]|uniref:cilia- and flagella-associated protein HOATZ isoform X2 n=1 Tax=Onychostoma macrolepis TaxID=369639 RepID=UPI00272B73E6|nr:cilia- and flagella-associated protein HOATZ isoform X2 [Onychostoma macrolepis]
MTEELDEEVLDSLAEIDKRYTVFDGASQEDVAYAKVFWNSLSLQPPIESRLVSADIRQRLRAAKTPRSTNATAKQASWSKRDEEIQQDAYLKQKQEERQKYMEMPWCSMCSSQSGQSFISLHLKIACSSGRWAVPSL